MICNVLMGTLNFILTLFFTMHASSAIDTATNGWITAEMETLTSRPKIDRLGQTKGQPDRVGLSIYLEYLESDQMGASGAFFRTRNATQYTRIVFKVPIYCLFNLILTLYNTLKAIGYSTCSQVSHTQGIIYLHTHTFNPQSEWAIPAFAFPVIAGTHLPTPEGWTTELPRVAGHVVRQFTCPKAVSIPLLDAGSGQNEHVLRGPFLCCCCTACLEQFARCCP